MLFLFLFLQLSLVINLISNNFVIANQQKTKTCSKWLRSHVEVYNVVNMMYFIDGSQYKTETEAEAYST